MKITPKILSIPPYLSARWSQVHSLYIQENKLVVCLSDGNKVSIPNLSEQEIEAIFAAHSAFSENMQAAAEQDIPAHKPLPPFFGAPGQNLENVAMQFNIDNAEAFGSAMQHNPEYSHIPNLPPEILSKIAAIAKIIAPGEIQNIPKAEPHCNCPHCQIARAIHGQPEEAGQPNYHQPNTHPENEEHFEDRDLSFQQWEISQIGDKLYSVANRLDTSEKYQVFLGEPLGCTCGHKGCEHILAVLKS